MWGIGVNNDTTPFYPAGYELDNILAVAAVDHQDQLATFSNYGATSVDLAAPGVDILSTSNNGGYALMTGTSMATPHVAGSAALVWDAHPEWTYAQVTDKLLSSVDVLPTLQGLVASNGRLNLATALDNPQPAPLPPPPGSLPLVEDFQDGQAAYFDARSANWSVENGRYRVASPVSDDQLAGISTIRLDTSLPADFELRATINAQEGRMEFFGIVLSDHLTNGLLIFDYHDQQDFKFASADVDGDRWVIGHRDALGWAADAYVGQSLDAATDYQLRLTVEAGHHVTLWADGQQVLSHDFAALVTDGDVGVGGRNSITYFDNVVARTYRSPVPTGLPLVDDLDDGAAEYLLEQSGIASLENGRLQLTPFVGGDAISTLLLSDPLPAELELHATFNAEDASQDRLSNAFLIFDYQDSTNFKFAGAFVGIDQWLIGHRTSNDWIADATLDAPIGADVDHDLQVTITADGIVTLLADGAPRVTFQFGDTLTDGSVGYGTKNALRAIRRSVGGCLHTTPHDIVTVCRGLR